MTNIHVEPAFHPDHMEVYYRLLRDLGAREQIVRRAVAEAQQVIADLMRERRRLADGGYEQGALEVDRKIRAQQNAVLGVLRQLEPLEKERESIVNNRHPELRAVLTGLTASATTRTRAKQEAEYKEASSAFSVLVPPECQAAFETLVAPLIKPDVQAAAVRLAQAARAIDIDPSNLTKALLGATPRAEK